MTVVELQAILATIDGKLDGKGGKVRQVLITNTKTRVTLGWALFRNCFAGQNAKSFPGDDVTTWRKTVDGVVYISEETGTGTTNTVPT